MADTNYTMLNEIKNPTDEITIKVRIIRFWRQADHNKPGEDYSKDFIMTDEKGNLMQGQCRSRFFYRFSPFLDENVCLVIKNPTILYVAGGVRYVDNEFKIQLWYDTTVKRTSDFSGPSNVFRFADFNKVLALEVSENESLDLIGALVKFTTKENVTTSEGKATTKMRIFLENLKGVKLSVTLWGFYEEQMSRFIKLHQNENQVVVALQFAKFKKWDYGTKGSVSNYYNVSRLYINKDIEEINQFKKSYYENSASVDLSSSGIISSSVVLSHEEIFLSKYEICNAADVKLIKEVKSVIVLGNIACVLNGAWYYDACENCKRKVNEVYNIDADQDAGIKSQSEKLYECKNGKCRGAAVKKVERFKIPIEVEDDSGTVKLTIFEPEGVKLIKLSGVEVFDNYLKAEIMTSYPEEFNQFIGRRYAFKVDISKFNLEQNYDHYGISKITDDPDIISRLEKKLLESQSHDENAISVNLSPKDLICKQPSSAQIAISSVADDNITPTSKTVKSNVTMAATEVGDDNYKKKRNIIDVDQIDDMVGHSTTKAMPTTNMNPGDKLKIPKLEM